MAEGALPEPSDGLTAMSKKSMATEAMLQPNLPQVEQQEKKGGLFGGIKRLLGRGEPKRSVSDGGFSKSVAEGLIREGYNPDVVKKAQAGDQKEMEFLQDQMREKSGYNSPNKHLSSAAAEQARVGMEAYAVSHQAREAEEKAKAQQQEQQRLQRAAEKVARSGNAPVEMTDQASFISTDEQNDLMDKLAREGAQAKQEKSRQSALNAWKEYNQNRTDAEWTPELRALNQLMTDQNLTEEQRANALSLVRDKIVGMGLPLEVNLYIGNMDQPNARQRFLDPQVGSGKGVGDVSGEVDASVVGEIREESDPLAETEDPEVLAGVDGEEDSEVESRNAENEELKRLFDENLEALRDLANKAIENNNQSELADVIDYAEELSTEIYGLAQELKSSLKEPVDTADEAVEPDLDEMDLGAKRERASEAIPK